MRTKNITSEYWIPSNVCHVRISALYYIALSLYTMTMVYMADFTQYFRRILMRCSDYMFVYIIYICICIWIPAQLVIRTFKALPSCVLALVYSAHRIHNVFPQVVIASLNVSNTCVNMIYVYTMSEKAFVQIKARKYNILYICGILIARSRINITYIYSKVSAFTTSILNNF